MCRQGEIDIIAKDKEEFVFIEVKTRRNMRYGRAREAVNNDKQKHIYKSTRFYLHIHGLENEFIRFDVIEIYFIHGHYKVRHLKQVDIKNKYRKLNKINQIKRANLKMQKKH